MRITINDIIQDDHPMIREKSELVSFPLSQEDEQLGLSMHEYVRDSTNEVLAETYNLSPAVGLAAIQVGVKKRILTVVIEQADETVIQYTLINPKIISYSSQYAYLVGGEGCLSVANKHEGNVYRPARIRVQAFDLLTKENITIKAKGYFAIVLQHELDHLDGILYYDHIGKALSEKEKLEAIAIE